MVKVEFCWEVYENLRKDIFSKLFVIDKKGEDSIKIQYTIVKDN